MKRFPHLSQAAQRRKCRVADNHKTRRHYHTLMVAQGYEPVIRSVEANGRKHRYYTKTWGPIPLGNSSYTIGKRTIDEFDEEEL